VKVAFNDAAANTVSVPAPAGAADAALDDAAEPTAFELDTGAPDAAEMDAAELEAAALVVEDAAVVPLELQLTAKVTTHSVASAAPTRRRWVPELKRLTKLLQGFR